MLDASHEINPKLAFVPCCYFPAIKPAFVTNYCPLIDGILFPYRHESAKANLKDPSLVEAGTEADQGIGRAVLPGRARHLRDGPQPARSRPRRSMSSRP